jgi:hypothetical protein
VSSAIRSSMTPLGPVHVRMTGVVRGDENGPGVAAINAPTPADATAALHRAARVNGADRILQVSSDYRRAAIAGGAAVTQWRIEVQAWGTAVARVDDTSAAEDSKREEADRLEKDAKRTADQDARAQAEGIASDAEADADRAAIDAEQASVVAADVPAPAPEPAAMSAVSGSSAPAPVAAPDTGTTSPEPSAN